MLTYDLVKRGTESLYEYLYKCIKEDIITGRIKPMEKLPSKRGLASNLGISVITVQNAYEQLLVEGYIYSEEKKGYYANETMSLTKSEEYFENMSLITSDNEQICHNVSEKDLHIPPLIDFSANHAVYDKFPYSTWTKIMRSVLLDNENIFGKSPVHKGALELRKAIADHLWEFRGLRVSTENIVVGAGTEYLYSLVVQLLGHNRIIAVEDPGHLKVSQIYENNGIRVIHIPVDKSGMSIDKLSNHIVSAIHISPSHHFPTGIVMPVKRRNQILEWAYLQGSYIIEDDYDSEFRFQGKLIPSMASLAGDRVIYMNTFSKTLAPSIRIAYMVLPDSLMEKYNKRFEFYSSTVSGFEQYTLAAFIGEGYYGRHISRMRNYYRGCRDVIVSSIKNSRLSSYAEIEEENAGLHFILKINIKMDDEEFCEVLLENGIIMYPVSKYAYNISDDFKHRFIINYSDIRESELMKAIEIICVTIEGLYKSC